MDILKAEIAKKRKLLEEKNIIDPTTNRKYFKRGDLLAKEQEEYMKKYGPQNQESGQFTQEEKHAKDKTLDDFVLEKSK